MELRPCAPGTEYHGPRRVSVTRPSGAQTFPGVIYRPRSRFWHLRSADYEERAKQLQQMAENRRAERKAEQDRLSQFGPDISIQDETDGPLDGDCRILKTLEHGDEVRLYFRRKDGIFIKISRIGF